MNGYVTAGWVIVCATLLAYTWRVLRRERTLRQAAERQSEPSS